MKRTKNSTFRLISILIIVISILISCYEPDISLNLTFRVQGNGSTTPIAGSGTIIQASAMVTGINVSSLDDSTLSLEFCISDPLDNDGDFVYDTVLKDTQAPSFTNVTHEGSDNIYTTGETITFTVNMGEPGLTIAADLSVLDSTFSSTQNFTDNGDNTVKAPEI